MASRPFEPGKPKPAAARQARRSSPRPCSRTPSSKPPRMSAKARSQPISSERPRAARSLTLLGKVPHDLRSVEPLLLRHRDCHLPGQGGVIQGSQFVARVVRRGLGSLEGWDSRRTHCAARGVATVRRMRHYAGSGYGHIYPASFTLFISQRAAYIVLGERLRRIAPPVTRSQRKTGEPTIGRNG